MRHLRCQEITQASLILIKLLHNTSSPDIGRDLYKTRTVLGMTITSWPADRTPIPQYSQPTPSPRPKCEQAAIRVH